MRLCVAAAWVVVRSVVAVGIVVVAATVAASLLPDSGVE